MIDLHPRTLDLIAGSGAVSVPCYGRSRLRRAVVHIGVGGFHRAHLATYIDDLARGGSSDWSIVGAGVLAGDVVMAEALGAQEGLYVLVSRDANEVEVRVIGSLVDYIHAYPDPAPLIDRIAHRETQIVSLTVTEGGYPVDDATGRYRPESTNAGPDSAFGILARGLDARRRSGAGPLTVLSCDNVLSNGSVARISTLGESAMLGSELVEWIQAEVAFPNSMVDRITPATTDADREWLADHRGLRDRWPVVAEPFRQWVVEDRFAGDRLPLEDLDVIVTTDVEPYEHMKLRLLNAGHSCLCYLAALDGVELVDQAMADPHLGRFERLFLEREARPVIQPVAGIDLGHYVDSLIERFSNPAIGDQIARLCLDGSVKFPKFLIPTVELQLEVGGPVALSALALAGWCEYLNGVDLHGKPIARSGDPNLEEAVAHAARSSSDPAAFLRFESVFGAVGSNERFREAFVRALNGLRHTGLRATIDDVSRIDHE